MSNTEICNTQLLVIPAESDEHFLRRLEYEDHLRKASVWLHKLIIHRIRDIQRIAPWYRGITLAPQHNEAERKQLRDPQLISELFSQEDGRFYDRFVYYCRMVKKYRQGDVPREIVEVDHRVVQIMIAKLVELIGDTETLRLLKCRIREFVTLITSRDNRHLLRNDYLQYIDKLADSIMTISGRVSDEFRYVEKVRRGEMSESATKADVALAVETAAKTDRKIDIVLAKQEETRKTVNRLDQRDKRSKKNGRRRFSVEVQELAHGFLIRGQKMSEVKALAKNGHKPGHKHIYQYFKRELEALGMKTMEDFEACLGSRSDRIYYSQAKKSVHQQTTV